MSAAGGDYRVGGVHVLSALPQEQDERPPVVFVHGGLHGSWCWHRFLPVFTTAGWACHALDWYGHHESDVLPRQTYVKRGIADVGEEIGLVAEGLAGAPVLVGHSMGGLACLKYAESQPVSALVLLAPVLPEVIGNHEANMNIDPASPWGPPPFELAQKLFFDGVPDDEARRYYGLLCPESPRCVAEATGRAAVAVELERITCPVLILVGEHDLLTPADRVQQLAERLDADFRRYPARSHSLLLDSSAEATAELAAGWLAAHLIKEPA